MNREVRGSLVHYPADHLCDSWIHFIYALFVLPYKGASIICTQDKTKGQVSHLFTLTCPEFTLHLGFSPHEAHAHQAFFGWIMPTIRTSELTVLQIVGLDAAVVCILSYFRIFPQSQLITPPPSFSTSSKLHFNSSQYVRYLLLLS